MSAEALSAARGGDETAFAELVAPHRGELHAHCYRMLGSVADAEDAVQETLLRAWRGLGAYEDRGSIRAWLYRIATNCCLSSAKRRGRRELPVGLDRQSGGEIAWLEPYPESALAWTAQLDPESRALAREAVELAFVAALQHLGGTQRAVLLLREVLGFSAAEVAEQLGVTAASVNSALQRARAAVGERVPPQSQHTTLMQLGDEKVRALAQRYADAWEARDVEALVGMLAEEARYSMPPLPEWYDGKESIRHWLLLADGPMALRWKVRPAYANGQLAVLTWRLENGDWRPAGVDVLVLDPAGALTEVVSFLAADVEAFAIDR